MLYLICAPDAVSVAFDAPLGASGSAQAALLNTWMDRTGIYVLYAAPSKRALDTIGGFVRQRRLTGRYVRAEIRFELCDRVVLPEQQPHALDVDTVRSYGVPPQNILGAMAGPEPTENDFHRRVVEWFSNDFMEKYRDAPNPTAIVADSAVLAAIITFLTRRQRNISIPLLKSGQAAEFKSDGLQLAFSQLLTLS
jgi:hypothetical protein